MSRRLRLALASIGLCVTTVACGDDERVDSDSVAVTSAAAADATEFGSAPFCEAMAHLIDLLAPTEDSSPAQTEATFAEAAGWFEQANRTAPAGIAGDVASYKTAFDGYADYLSTVGFNLDRVFSSPQGRQLAIDTSHTLTPAIVGYVVDTCGLSFGAEEHEPPTTA